MPKDEPISQSNRDSDSKIRQIQQYLHRPWQISAAPHPFVKQAIEQSTRHWKQQHSPSFWQRIAW